MRASQAAEREAKKALEVEEKSELEFDKELIEAKSTDQ